MSASNHASDLSESGSNRVQENLRFSVHAKPPNVLRSIHVPGGPGNFSDAFLMVFRWRAEDLGPSSFSLVSALTVLVTVGGIASLDSTSCTMKKP